MGGGRKESDEKDETGGCGEGRKKDRRGRGRKATREKGNLGRLLKVTLLDVLVVTGRSLRLGLVLKVDLLVLVLNVLLEDLAAVRVGGADRAVAIQDVDLLEG